MTYMTPNNAIEGTATNGDVTLRWERFANTADDAMPLLLVNGLSSPMVSYDVGFVEELLIAGFEVVRFDNRDAGRSTLTTGGYLLADMADDAVAVLDAVGWSKAHVFGMSMGGMIVQQLGIDHADRLLSITSVMSTTGNQEYGTSSKDARTALLTPSPEDREEWLTYRVDSQKIWASPAEWTPESSRAEGERLFDYGMHPRHVAHQYNAIMNSGDREDALRSVQTPTLVLHGPEDTLIHISGGQRTAEIMPNATFIELPGMGHDLPAAYWASISSHVRDLAAAT